MAVHERVELLYKGARLHRVVVEDLVGAEFTAEVGVTATGDGRDTRAHGLAEMDGGAADSTAGADYQEPLAALQPQPVPQSLQSREADGGQRRRRDEVDAGGRGRHPLRFRDEILGAAPLLHMRMPRKPARSGASSVKNVVAGEASSGGASRLSWSSARLSIISPYAWVDSKRGCSPRCFS